MFPFQTCLSVPDLPTATSALVTAFGDDGTGNPLIDPTQVVIDYVGPQYNDLTQTWDGKENVNIASMSPLPSNLTSSVVTPILQKRVFANDALQGFTTLEVTTVEIDPDLAGGD